MFVNNIYLQHSHVEINKYLHLLQVRKCEQMPFEALSVLTSAPTGATTLLHKVMSVLERDEAGLVLMPLASHGGRHISIGMNPAGRHGRTKRCCLFILTLEPLFSGIGALALPGSVVNQEQKNKD